MSTSWRWRAGRDSHDKAASCRHQDAAETHVPIWLHRRRRGARARLLLGWARAAPHGSEAWTKPLHAVHKTEQALRRDRNGETSQFRDLARFFPASDPYCNACGRSAAHMYKGGRGGQVCGVHASRDQRATGGGLPVPTPEAVCRANNRTKKGGHLSKLLGLISTPQSCFSYGRVPLRRSNLTWSFEGADRTWGNPGSSVPRCRSVSDGPADG